MQVLNPTPSRLLADSQRRPYFLWDMIVTLEEFRELLVDPDADVRAYYIGKLMREAKPDDVFRFVTPRTIRQNWWKVERHLGRSRDFWTWVFATWARLGFEWK